jgi:site-specific recombinase XerD
MIKEFQTFDELLQAATAYLKSLCYSANSIDAYRLEWHYLARHLQDKGISQFNATIGSQYLSETIGDMERKAMPRSKRNRVRAIMVLSDFVETGTIRKVKRRQKPKQLDGPIGKLMAAYIIQSQQVFQLASSTVQSYHLYLSVFLSFLNGCHISSFAEFNANLIVNFIKSLSEYSIITRHLIILKTNQFLKHLFDNQLLPADYSKIAPKDAYVRQPKLPSYYSPAEIDQLLGSIDRANPNGKRDYAMLILVVRLGLRCSDIANMTFDTILWERELIILTQIKTKEKVELPLLPEVGDAIIDYLKYGRPQSGLPYIFLRQIPPYTNMNSNILHGIIKKYLNRSGIKYDDRRHGPHALRHSLATSLLGKETPLPVISSILGHTRIESTMIYLRVDNNSLRKCALEVPGFTVLDTKTKEVKK